MAEVQQVVFTNSVCGERLDKVIVAALGDTFSRAQIQTLIKEGHVTVNGETAKPSIKLKGGEQIILRLPSPSNRQDDLAPEAIPLRVSYEDADIAVIDKPAGLIVHPGSGRETGTLAHAILARWPQIAQIDYAPQRRGIVHRLDKGTSGLILIAKHTIALRRLMHQFQRRTVDKFYLALLERPPRTPTGRINAPIGRDPVHRQRMAVLHDGRPAISEFRTLERFKTGHTLVEVRLLTGRTHQIRVHMAFIGCPIVGDTTYGFRRPSLPLGRQFLHAARLCFDHPQSGERLCFESPLPADLQRVLDDLRR